MITFVAHEHMVDATQQLGLGCPGNSKVVTRLTAKRTRELKPMCGALRGDGITNQTLEALANLAKTVNNRAA